MSSGLEGFAKARSEYLWVVSELIAERIFSAVLMFCMTSEVRIAKAKEFIRSARSDEEYRRYLLEDHLYLVEGASESDINLIANEYIPAFLETQIELLEKFDELSQSSSVEITPESMPKRRRIGFITDENDDD